jgi:hypothetical protein
MPWHAFMPFPRPGLHFWNTNLLDPWPALQAAAGLLVLGLAVALLWRRKVALTVFCIGAAGVLAFGYIKLAGLLRHQGHLWLLFVAALWLGGVGQDLQANRRSWRARAFLGLLILHCAAAAYASWMDLRHPFSLGAATAELIRARGLDRHPLLGYREPPVPAVALTLGRPLYSPSRDVLTTHPDWGPRQRDLSLPELRCAARELARREGRDIVLVMTLDLPPWDEVELIDSRLGAIVESEEFRLYRLRHGRLDGTVQAAQCGAAR